MDKQIIEEMAKDINNTWFVKSNGDICGTNEKLKKNDINMIAQQLVCKGYRKIPENAVVLTREEYERLLDANFGVMTSPIGDLEINPKGMLKAVDEIARLGRVETELQDLNAKYYNEAKDLRRNMAKLRRETYPKEEVDYKLEKTRKETAEKFAERLKEKIREQEERFANEQHRLEEKLPKLKYESDIPIVKSQADKANGQATMACKVELYIDEICKEFTGEKENET